MKAKLGRDFWGLIDAIGEISHSGNKYAGKKLSKISGIHDQIMALVNAKRKEIEEANNATD